MLENQRYLPIQQAGQVCKDFGQRNTVSSTSRSNRVRDRPQQRRARIRQEAWTNNSERMRTLEAIYTYNDRRHQLCIVYRRSDTVRRRQST